MSGKHQVCVYNFGFEQSESHRGPQQAKEADTEQSPEEFCASSQACAKYTNTYRSQAALLK